MPRVNIYRGNAIERTGTTGAKLVAADFSASPLGEGLQRLGRAGSEYVEKHDQIEALYDEQDAQRLDLEHVKQTQVLSDRLREARGAGAREAATGLERELADFNSTLLQRARSQRARTILENSVARRSVGEVERYHAYADQEFVQDFRATNDASITASLERANDIENPELSRTELEGTAFARIEERARFEGWEGGAQGPQATALRLRVTTGYHMNRARQLARSDPSAAIDYAVTHRDEMSDEAFNGILDSQNNEAIEQRMTAFVDGQAEYAPAPEAANDSAPSRPAREETPIAYTWETTSGFGHRTAPTAGATTNHPGVDYRVASGTQVPVTLSGRVTIAGPQGGYGNMVEVDHGNGLRTRYAHLSQVNVRPGQQVSRGDIVALSGATGRVTGPHLHYEVRQDGRPVDPHSIAHATVHPGGTHGIRVDPGSNVETLVRTIRENPTLSWREKQVAEGIVRQRHGQALQARAQVENEHDRAAAATVAQLGESFTSMSQLPNGGADLGPQDRLRYSNMAQSNRHQVENEPPSPELMLWVNYQRFANPSFYASGEFLQQARQHGASAAMLRNIAADQGQILGTRTPADRARIWSIAEPILNAAGINYDTLDTPESDRGARAAERQQDAIHKNALLSNLEQVYNIWAGAHPGQPPPDELVREWVARSTSQTGAGPVSLLAETDREIMARLGPADRARAERSLRAASLPVNEQTVAMFMRHWLATTRAARR